MQSASFFRFLKRRNTMLIVVFLLAWLVSLDLIWYLPTRQSLERSASDLSLQVAESASSNVRATLERDLENVQFAAADIREMPEMRDTSLMRLTMRSGSVLRVVVIDDNGTVQASAGSLPDGVAEPDYSKLPGVYVAFAGSPNFGTVTTLPDGTPMTYIAVPMSVGQNHGEVIIAAVSLASLKTNMQTIASGNWRIYITDKSGNEIIAPDAGVTHRSLIDRPIVQKVVVDGFIADGLAPEDTYTNELGTLVFAVGKPIPIANWSLFVERPRAEALKQESTIGLLALAILVLGAFTIFVAMGSYWRLDTLNARLREQGDELKDKNERLQELDKMKSEFLSVAAHQLRTPLSALKWSFEALLENQGIDPEQRSTILKGSDSNERMIRLVDDMLAVTRIEAGKVRYNFVPLHIEDVVDNVMLDFISQARAHKLMLSFERPPQKLPYITADPERMHDIIGNLLENAIRYTPAGGSITVHASEDKGFIKVGVTDTGIGIPPAQQASIFNKFFRADNAAKVQTDGSGLGLFIAKATVEKHGGKIWFESAEGKGTTFYFTIPVRAESAQT